MLPPAPARFSTTTCCPRSSPSTGATMRAVVSVPPPGSKPTTVVIGLAGYEPCAAAAPLATSAAISTMNLIHSSYFSAALENGLSLFHEGSAAFAVVLAIEALLHPGSAGRGIVLVCRDLSNDAFRRAHGERRVRRDHVAVLTNRLLQLGHRHHLVHQAHVACLFGGELTRGDHDLERVGLADYVDEVFHGARAIAQAHLRRRDAEAGMVGGDARVAEVGDVEPAADAVATDHGDHRLLEGLEPGLRLLADLVVVRHRLGGGALLFELRDVGAGDEGLVARAGEHHDANGLIGAELGEHRGNRFPHVKRHGVAPLGVVEDEPADGAVLAG